MQRMSENFIDAFGFQDAAFNDDGVFSGFRVYVGYQFPGSGAKNVGFSPRVAGFGFSGTRTHH